MSVTEQTENDHPLPDSNTEPQATAGPDVGETSLSFAGPYLATAGLTHPGQVRPLNEDSWQIAGESETGHLWEPRGRLMSVADGMGGHAAGEVASHLAVEKLHQQYYDEDHVPLPPAIRLERAVTEANLSVYEQAVAVDAQSGMGTTLVAAVIHDGRVLIANVGDSRAYLIRDGQAIQITHDHSWVAEQVKLGTITVEQAQNHAYRNLVTRCLGHRPGMQVDIFEHRLRAKDTLLLCSDGLSNQVSDSELAAVLTEQEPEQAVQTLVDMANEKGGPDNITAVVARVLQLPVRPAEAESDRERPERLEAKTTQPVRLEREQIEAAEALEAAAEQPHDLQTGALLAPTRPARKLFRVPLSPRRRATLLLALIALFALLAVAILIAVRAEKIKSWLAWPSPVSQLYLVPQGEGMLGMPGLMLATFLQLPLWTYATPP
jgi:serine/threonine protein phosphatase PrpC